MEGSPPPREIDVSVVLPVFNEVGHVALEVERISAALRASDLHSEIIVVDDGSTDGTAEVLAGLDDIRLLTFTENRGCGAARRAGTEVARGRLVAWTDADMSYPNERIPEMVGLLGGRAQIVGARSTEHGSSIVVRRAAKSLIRWIAAYAMATPIPDLNSGLRVFRRDVAEPYLDRLPDGFSCVTTMTMSFLADGHAVGYVPIDYFPRAGRGKFHWRSDTRRYVQRVLVLGVRLRPARMAVPVGAGLLAATAAVRRVKRRRATRS